MNDRTMLYFLIFCTAAMALIGALSMPVVPGAPMAVVVATNTIAAVRIVGRSFKDS